MSEDLFDKIVRALPVQKAKGWGGFFTYLRTSTSPQAAPAVGPTSSEVLASDQRIRRSMTGQIARATRRTGGLAGQPARLTMPTLIGL